MPDRKSVGRSHQDVGNVAGHEHARERHDTARDALGERDHVGGHAPLLDAEPGTCATKAGDCLVANHQEAVARAELADPLEVPIWRRHGGPARARDGFEKDASDLVCPACCDRVLKLLDRELDLVGGRASRADIGIGRLGDRVLGQQGLERIATARTRQSKCRNRGAVIRRVARDELRLRRLAEQLPIEQGQMDRRLDGFGAGRVEERPRAWHRGNLSEQIGELEHRLVRECKTVRKCHFVGLALECLDQARVAMTNAHHHRATTGVDKLAPIRCPDATTLSPHGDRELAPRSGSQREVRGRSHRAQSVPHVGCCATDTFGSRHYA